MGSNMTIMTIAVAVVAAVIALVLGSLLGWNRRKSVAEKEISSAEEEATRIINEAIKSAENKKREAMVEAKEEILKQRSEYEKEVKERRADLQKQERRLQQKEENIDRKTDAIERKEESLAEKHAQLDRQREEIQQIKRSQTELLERISGFTAEEAKAYLIEQVQTEVTHEAAMKIKEIEARAKDEADARAKEIIATAIQRCAADQVSEITVSVVPLPNDEMKGRIIGREGRNIRTLETMTGVDLIIDDTPEAITVSCFEPVRREIARLALEKLIADGRIHPTRIEEMVEKAKREVDAVIKSEGERATFETGVRGLHPELVKMLGRLHYRTSYGQNVLRHSIEVSQLAGMMAAELGTDVQAAKRAGCCTTWARAWTMKWKAPTWPWAWSSPASTTKRRHHPRHPRPPRRRGAPDPGGLPRAGGGRHFRSPARRPAGEPGELYQAPGAAGEHCQQLPRRGKVLCHSGRPRDPRDGQARGSVRGRDGSWPGTWPKRSRKRWNIPARSRSTSCGRPRLWNTPSK